jgi:diaminopimelate epimerase
MKINFTKMHGLGNDFVVINNLDGHIVLTNVQIRRLANRHTGIGFDQLLMIASPSVADADFDYVIYNADGSESGQCGNGARCFALYIKMYSLSTKVNLSINTSHGMIFTHYFSDDKISVNLGAVNFEPSSIPVASMSYTATDLKNSAVDVVTDRRRYSLSLLSLGNPHAIIQVSKIQEVDLSYWGKDLQDSKYFPQQVNLSIVEIIDNNSIKIRVYERGVGETLACGSGACASAIASCLHYGLSPNITVHMLGGKLTLQYSVESNSVTMIGAASSVFEGSIYLD